MIGKVCRRGTDTRRLLGYLFTEGLAGERGLDSAHVDARVIAGYQPSGGLEPDRRPDGRADVSRLAALLDAPVRAGGVGKDAKATYHLAISAAPADRLLTDAEWADIAELYVDRLGLAKRGDDNAVRWVAVRHADNHVHVVATLVRQDGRRLFPHHDFYRAREASLAVEHKYGLTPTSAVDRTGNPETTRAEQRKHQGAVRAAAQNGLPTPAGPDREVLRARVRAALAGSQGWEEFAGRLRSSGVLVRERYSTRNPSELTGYAVGLPTTGVRLLSGGPLHAAAEDFSRAARDLHRRPAPPSSRGRSTRTAAGGLLRAGLVKRAETRQLLSLLTSLTALAESLARLRETQGRAAQALAARRAAEQLTREQHRRAGAASAAVSPVVKHDPVSAALSPPHRMASRPAPRGASPSR